MQKGDILTTCRKVTEDEISNIIVAYIGDMQNRDRNTYKMGTH